MTHHTEFRFPLRLDAWTQSVARATGIAFLCAATFVTAECFADEVAPARVTPTERVRKNKKANAKSRLLPPPQVRRRKAGTPLIVQQVVAPPDRPGQPVPLTTNGTTPMEPYSPVSPESASGAWKPNAAPGQSFPNATAPRGATPNSAWPSASKGTKGAVAERSTGSVGWSFPADGGEPNGDDHEPASGSDASGNDASGNTEGPSTSTILGLKKLHNQRASTGDPALVIKGTFEAVKQDGEELRVAVWFMNRRTNRRLPSAMPAFADASNFLTAQSHPVSVEGARARYEFSLYVAYGAFPQSTKASPTYDVDAWVQLYRNESGERITVLAEKKTSFRVYGSPKPQSAAKGKLNPNNVTKGNADRRNKAESAWSDAKGTRNPNDLPAPMIR